MLVFESKHNPSLINGVGRTTHYLLGSMNSIWQLCENGVNVDFISNMGNDDIPVINYF